MLSRGKRKFYLATTRFNEETWNENRTYREHHNISGCIYGTPKRIGLSVPKHSFMFILEMKNIPLKMEGGPGKIMGIGYIRNSYYYKKPVRIYKDRTYNRYCYRSDYRIDRHDMKKYDKELLSILEEMVFYGYSHLKRGQGITCDPNRKIEKVAFRDTLKKRLIALFMKKFV